MAKRSETKESTERESSQKEPVFAIVFAKLQNTANVFEIQKSISALAEVGLVCPVTGEFDLLILVQVAGGPQLGEFIVRNISELPVIKSKTILSYTAMIPVNWLLESIG